MRVDLNCDLGEGFGQWTLADDEALAVFGAQLEDAKSPPTLATWEEVASAVDSELEKVVVGGEDPAAAVEAMQQQASSIGTGS